MSALLRVGIMSSPKLTFEPEALIFDWDPPLDHSSCQQRILRNLHIFRQRSLGKMPNGLMGQVLKVPMDKCLVLDMFRLKMAGDVDLIILNHVNTKKKLMDDTSGRPYLPHPPSSYPIRKAHRVTPGQTIVTPGFKSPRHSGSDASCFEVVANFESCP